MSNDKSNQKNSSSTPQRELTAEERLAKQRNEAVENLPITMLSQHPFIRALASRVIRLERELKPVLLAKYQNPEATKAAFDTPVPDQVVDAWLGEVFRQANLDQQKTEEILKAQAQAELDRKAREREIQQELNGIPAQQRREIEQALAAKAQ